MTSRCTCGGTGRSAALAVVAALATIVCARADVPAYFKARPDAAVKAFGPEIAGKIFSDDFTPLRQDAALRSARSLPGFDCPAEPPLTVVDVVPYPVKPGALSWIESYVVGCTPRAKRNFMLLFDGERGRIAELLPGSTITDPGLQHDASHSAKTFAKSVRPADCGRTILIDTLLAAPPETPGATWSERWTFDQCAARTFVEMTFTPTPKGTTWSARLVP
jgi:hypothetical protein